MSEETVNIDRIVEIICSMPGLARQIVFVKLFESGAIDFARLVEMYVEKLDKENKQKQGAIATLGLMLASYSMNDTSNLGKTSRKHLYDSGAFGNNDGSVFGKMLDEEFGELK